MTDKNRNIINTAMLFYALNANRRNRGLSEIDNPLIASKLGILFALKTNGYVNFKGERVELSNEQLTALQEILDQHFNAQMTEEIHALVVTPEKLRENQTTTETRYQSTRLPTDNGLFSKIKGFLKTKPKVQERPA